MSTRLFERCVYTCIDPDALEEADRGSRPSLRLRSGKKWVHARNLLAEANASGRELPIIFSHADGTTALRCWAVLRRVDVDDDGTWFTFVDRRALKKRKKTELRVVSTGQRIPRDHSRPYAICQTPEFLVREASTGKSAVKGVPERAEPRHPLPDEEEYLIPPVPSDATWREVLLERVGGESPMPHIVLFARSDEGADPEDPDVRVWCENLVDESPWNGIENAWIEDGKVRLEFPITLYYGMPSHLFLDLPTRAPVGAQIRLFREDHRLFGFYVVKQRRAEVASDEVVRVEAALESTGDSIW